MYDKGGKLKMATATDGKVKALNQHAVLKATMSPNPNFDQTLSDEISLNLDASNADEALNDGKRNSPIGIFDSGIGGLSVYLHLAKQLPDEQYIYYADTLHVPYGNRDSKDIENLTLMAVKWLYEQGCKLIVIACNSASAYALEAARQHYPQLPIVGLVPALKPAVSATQTAHVAVLATKATLNGKLLDQVITDIALPNAIKVTKYFDPELVPWVEAGMPERSDTAQRLREQIQVFAKEGVDQLVLGCTHYPFFKGFLLQEIIRQHLSMNIVDSGQAIAERVKQLLVTHQLLAPPVRTADSNRIENANMNIRSTLVFYASKYDSGLDRLIRRLLGDQINIQYYL